MILSEISYARADCVHLANLRNDMDSSLRQSFNNNVSNAAIIHTRVIGVVE